MDNQKADDAGYYAEDYQDYEELEDVEDDIDDDESIEAFGEDDIDDDEAYEADDDDDDESIEAYQEDDLDDDEAYEVEDYDDDEGFEEDDDDDEEFEEGYAEAEDIDDDDEAFAAERSSRRAKRRAASRRARIRAKRRARIRKMRLLAAQKRATRNARRTRARLNKKLRVIRGPGGRVPMRRYGKARGTGFVTAILANGRRTKMMFKPTLATRADVNRLTRQISVNSAKQGRALRVQAKNIKLLKSAQSSAVKSLTAQQLKSSKLLGKQITDGDKVLDKRITKLVSNQKKSGRRQDAKMLRQIRQQQQRSRWNSVLIASAIPLFAAYGDRAVGDGANPFTKKNMIIAGSTAGWLFADDLIDRFVTRGSKKWRTAGNVWNIAAPLANWATVYFFMKDKQHERIVTGVATVPNDGAEHEFEVLNHIGEDDQSDFKSIANPRVVANIQSQTGGADATGVQARIDNGKLRLMLTGGGEGQTGSAEVAWYLDTMDPSDQRTSSSVS